MQSFPGSEGKGRCLIIAEAGVNHNASVDLALEMIDTAARAGADAVKFQTFKAEKLVRPGAEKAAYQRRETGSGEDQLMMLGRLELPDSAYPALVARCREQGIKFLSTPFDEASASMLVSLGMEKIKVPSGEVTNLPFLRFLAGFGLPMILSTGMATLDEVAEAIESLQGVWSASGRPVEAMVTLLQCTSNYPALPEDVNLRAMETMRDAFGLPVGYSDHTLGTAVAVAAVALGATVLEKHFTLDRNLPGPDHSASLEPQELTELVRQIRTVEAALGNGAKEPRQSELPVRDVARRSVTLTCPVACGASITREMLSLMRPGTGIAPKFLDSVIGRHAARDLSAWTTLTWEDLAR